MGYDAEGKRIVAKNSHNTVIRRINYRKGYTPAKNDARDMKSIIHSAQLTASYSSKSLLLGNFEYPFPTGLYLSRVVQLTRSIPSCDPMLQMITDPCLGNKYSKEISEIMVRCCYLSDVVHIYTYIYIVYLCTLSQHKYSMYIFSTLQAMVDATDRAVKLAMGVEPSTLSRVTVFAVGDGRRPLSAAAICLNMPSSWKYVSIDPLLEPHRVKLGDYSHRFSLFGGLSQDFDLSHTMVHDTATATAPTEEQEQDQDQPPLAIVIALHSHAPLSEFWKRLGGRKLAVTMACCAEFSELHSAGEVPIMEFEDFEVYSPKRTVKIYSSSSSSSTSSLPSLHPPEDSDDKSASQSVKRHASTAIETSATKELKISKTT
jgi:hypothetical protein